MRGPVLQSEQKMAKTFNFEVEGFPVKLEFSSHSRKRLEERDVPYYEACSLVVKLGESILEMKNGEEFGVVDRDLRIGLVGAVNCLDRDIFVDVKTVLYGERIYFSRGMKVFELEDMKWPA